MSATPIVQRYIHGHAFRKCVWHLINFYISHRKFYSTGDCQQAHFWLSLPISFSLSNFRNRSRHVDKEDPSAEHLPPPTHEVQTSQAPSPSNTSTTARRAVKPAPPPKMKPQAVHNQPNIKDLLEAFKHPIRESTIETVSRRNTNRRPSSTTTTTMNTACQMMKLTTSMMRTTSM